MLEDLPPDSLMTFLKTFFLILSLLVVISYGVSEVVPDPKTNSQDSASLTIAFVPVGDVGNSSDVITHLGAVALEYQIGKYEITVAEWSFFLNAVATKEDPHGLYDERMSLDSMAPSIERSLRDDGTYHYTPIPGKECYPITYVGYFNALRFCNWLQNGQPNQLQGDDLIKASTEHGSYAITRSPNGEEQAEWSNNALYFLPSEDQWIKAAYYAGGGLYNKYWLYPTQHDLPPNSGDPTNMIVEIGACYSNIATLPLMNPGPQPVNFYEESQGSYGTCDMGGNVAEWITRSDPAHPNTLSPLTRGGSWASPFPEDSKRTDPGRIFDASEAALGNKCIGFRIATLGNNFSKKNRSSMQPSIKTTDTFEKIENHDLKIIADIIKWGLFFVDITMLVSMLGGLLCSMIFLLLGPELFAIVLLEVPLFALLFSIGEISFSVTLLVTLCSFLMDWITHSGYSDYAFDIVSLLLDLLKLLI